MTGLFGGAVARYERFVAALVLSALVGVFTLASVVESVPFGGGLQYTYDSYRYVKEARQLRDGDGGFPGYRAVTDLTVPGYPQSVALASLMFDGDVSDGARAVSTASGVAIAFLGTMCVGVVARRRLAFYAGVLVVVSGPSFIAVTVMLMTDALNLALSLGAIFLCLRCVRRQRLSWGEAALMGLLLGAALMTRYQALIVIPGIAIALLFMLAVRQQAIASAAALLQVALVCAAPATLLALWLWRNEAYYGRVSWHVQKGAQSPLSFNFANMLDNTLHYLPLPDVERLGRTLWQAHLSEADALEAALPALITLVLSALAGAAAALCLLLWQTQEQRTRLQTILVEHRILIVLALMVATVLSANFMLLLAGENHNVHARRWAVIFVLFGLLLTVFMEQYTLHLSAHIRASKWPGFLAAAPVAIALALSLWFGTFHGMQSWHGIHNALDLFKPESIRETDVFRYLREHPIPSDATVYSNLEQRAYLGLPEPAPNVRRLPGASKLPSIWQGNPQAYVVWTVSERETRYVDFEVDLLLDHTANGHLETLYAGAGGTVFRVVDTKGK